MTNTAIKVGMIAEQTGPWICSYPLFSCQPERRGHYRVWLPLHDLLPELMADVDDVLLFAHPRNESDARHALVL